MGIHDARVTLESKDVHWVVKMVWHFLVIQSSTMNVDLVQIGNGTEKTSRVFLNAFVSILIYLPYVSL